MFTLRLFPSSRTSDVFIVQLAATHRKTSRHEDLEDSISSRIGRELGGLQCEATDRAFSQAGVRGNGMCGGSSVQISMYCDSALVRFF